MLAHKIAVLRFAKDNLLWSGDRVSCFFPMTMEWIDETRTQNTEEKRVAWEALESFFSRFAKLQDLLGPAFRSLLNAEMEPNANSQPFLEMLADMEKRGVIDSLATWRDLRDVRNGLSHPYLGEEASAEAVINRVKYHCDTLADYVDRFEGYCFAHFPVLVEAVGNMPQRHRAMPLPDPLQNEKNREAIDTAPAATGNSPMGNFIEQLQGVLDRASSGQKPTEKELPEREPPCGETTPSGSSPSPKRPAP